MSKKKACKKCKLFTEEEVCPNCKSNDFSTNWQGRIAVIVPEKSMIAEKIGIEKQGEYAIKVR